MSKIYISYNHEDKEIAILISNKLKDAGHIITLDAESLLPGTEWRTTLSADLKSGPGRRTEDRGRA